MVSKTGKSMLVAAFASAMMMGTSHAAQAPEGTPRIVRTAPPGVAPPAQVVAPPDFFTTMQRLGLLDPALQLTPDQRARIEKTVQAYVAEQYALTVQTAARNTVSGEQALAARRAAREKLTAVVEQLLTSQQREIRQASPAARIARMSSGSPGDARQK